MTQPRTVVDVVRTEGLTHKFLYEIGLLVTALGRSETGEPCPYISLNDGLEAKLNRSTFYDLVALGVEEKVEQAQIFGVWSGGIFHKLGDAVECDPAGAD